MSTTRVLIRRAARGGVALAACAALLLSAADASAQSDEERAAARVAAMEGAKAFRAGDFQQAVDLFERAESLVHAPPHLMFLARGYANLGRLVKAREMYMKAIKETLPANAPVAFTRAQESARTELPELEPRIPKMRIVVKGAEGDEEVRVTMDGEPIPRVLIGLPAPVDPGKHEFLAIAEGKSSGPIDAAVEEGASGQVVLELKPDPSVTLKAPEEAAPMAAPAEAPPGGEPGSVADEAPPQEGGGGLRIGAYVGLGVGVVGLGLGTVFALKSGSEYAEVEKLCPDPDACPSSAASSINDHNDAAGSAQTLSLVGFIIGGVGIATGATLFVLSLGGGESEQASVELQPWVGVGGAGVSGKF